MAEEASIATTKYIFLELVNLIKSKRDSRLRRRTKCDGGLG